MNKKYNEYYFAALADEAGLLKAESAKISKRLAVIKKTFDDNGVTEADGEFYRATFSLAERINQHWKDLALSLKPSRQKLTAFKTTDNVATFKVVALKS